MPIPCWVRELPYKHGLQPGDSACVFRDDRYTDTFLSDCTLGRGTREAEDGRAFRKVVRRCRGSLRWHRRDTGRQGMRGGGHRKRRASSSRPRKTVKPCPCRAATLPSGWRCGTRRVHCRQEPLALIWTAMAPTTCAWSGIRPGGSSDSGTWTSRAPKRAASRLPKTCRNAPRTSTRPTCSRTRRHRSTRSSSPRRSGGPRDVMPNRGPVSGDIRSQSLPGRMFSSSKGAGSLLPLPCCARFAPDRGTGRFHSDSRKRLGRSRRRDARPRWRLRSSRSWSRPTTVPRGRAPCAPRLRRASRILKSCRKPALRRVLRRVQRVVRSRSRMVRCMKIVAASRLSAAKHRRDPPLPAPLLMRCAPSCRARCPRVRRKQWLPHLRGRAGREPSARDRWRDEGRRCGTRECSSRWMRGSTHGATRCA